MKIKTEAHRLSNKFGNAEIKIGRVHFIAAFFFRVFDVGVRVSRYSLDLALGFFTLSLDWYDYGDINKDLWLDDLEKDFIDG